MAETYAIRGFAPIACAFGYALLGSDGSQC